ncbi:glycosyltransferase [Delftia sp. PE138]|uniref:glycosyltransferase n=1 Tax=Delftia sp. PE138 TaxID=1812483 RepID=UPI001BAE7A14|nr:glycosyltransferase [Delftia sp. PE138]MBS3720482.1 UDP-N-acetylglucosamine--peptide N-acetylglucosaminyltransferase GtfA subunit [Delftia sp. PE138]
MTPPAKPKKIIFFVPSLIGGGAEKVALLLARSMSGLGCEIKIATARKNGELAYSFPENVKIIDFACNKPISGIRTLSKLVASSQADAIICFGIQTGIAAALSQRMYKWKSTLIIRNENNLELEWKNASKLNQLIGPALSRWSAKQSKFVCVSRTLSQATKQYLKLHDDEVITIRNPVFDNIDWPQSEKPLHPWLASSSLPTFVAIGRLEHQKGFDTLIDGFKIANETIQARLIIFGNGGLRNQLEERIESAGLSNHISLPGFTENPLHQLRAATAFILSSRYEGFGLVLVEALFSGTTIISTDCNYGPSEILEDGKYGILLPVNDPHSIANAIINSANGSINHERPSPEWYREFLSSISAKKHLELT